MNETRPTKEQMFMAMAVIASQRSTCHRARVGCIVTNADGTAIVSMGYNGNARGLTNDCDTYQQGVCGCLHAEENALLKAPYGQNLILYTTTSPCLHCAKRILNSSVSKVFYLNKYRNFDGALLLMEHDVVVEHLLFPNTDINRLLVDTLRG